MTRREAGRIGGRRTFELYGPGHMAAIGRKGFAALATFKNGGRSGAFAALVNRGRLTPRRPVVELTADQTSELCAAVGFDEIPW